MKAAIWGFGSYGRDMFEKVSTSLPDKYEITTIFDRAYASMTAPASNVILCDPVEIAPRFEAGEFEGVFACAGNPVYYKKFRSTLESLGIPVLAIASPDVMHPAESLDCAIDPQMKLIDDGYALATCQDLYGFVHSTASQPLLVYHDGNGHIVYDTWFKDCWEFDSTSLNFAQRYDRKPENCVFLPGDYCAVNRFWGKNYWHFTFQHLDQIAVMEAAGFNGSYIIAQTKFASEIMNMLSVPPDRILWIDDLDANTAYCFERISFLHHKGFIYRDKVAVQPLLRCAKALEKALDERFDYRGFPKRLFVKRIGTRKLVGAERTLEQHGFVTIVPEELSAGEQMAHFRAADIVITPHGANSANSLYMRPGSVFIEAFSHNWGIPMCVEPLYAKSVGYISIPGNFNTAEAASDVDADFKVNASLLRMAIRNAEHLLEHRCPDEHS